MAPGRGRWAVASEQAHASQVATTFALCLVPIVAACSFTLDSDAVQCRVSDDCVALGLADGECVNSVCVEAVSASFACLGETWPEQESALVDVEVNARTLMVGEPVPDIEVRACNTLLDPRCESPVATSNTSADGKATLAVPSYFRGHFFAPTPDADARAPHILHMHPPPDAERPPTLQLRMTVTNLQTLRDIAALAGRPFVDGRGHVFFSALGCDGELLAGVRLNVVDAPSDAVIAYLGANGLPDESLEDTGSNGRGAIINLEPGFVTVQGFHDEVGKIFEQVLLLDADTITTTSIVPSPF